MKRIWWFVLVLWMGCGTTATIHTTTTYEYEAELVASDENTLRVRSDYSGVIDIPRDTVTEVDHPGNGHFVAGLIVSGVAVFQGTAGLVLLATDEPIEIVGGQLLGSVIYATVGGILTWWGFKTWKKSKRALEPGNRIPAEHAP